MVPVQSGSPTKARAVPDALGGRLAGLRLERHDAIAVLTVAAYCLTAAVLCSLLGASFTPALSLVALVPAFFIVLAALFHLARPQERTLFHILGFIGLWGALPIAGTQLTFLAHAAALPLQTDLLLRADAWLGFSWISWATFIRSHPPLEWLTAQAYLSYAYQPYIALIVIALFGPRSRNANFIIATALALGITIAISIFVPAIEPARAYGFPTPAADAMLNLRNGQRSGLPYIGIICFPSFHAAMTVLFVMAYRGIRFAMVPACLVNGVMMFSIPFSGDHYLIDLIGGIAVALGAQRLADRITRESKAGPAARAHST